MDAAAGVTASQKAMDTLKSIPTWLLVGLCLSILLIWVVPAFHSVLPQDMTPWLPLALVIAAVLAACQIASSVASRVGQRRQITSLHDRQKLVYLYRPLAALFLTRHVTSCTATNAPYLRHRIENARIELGSYRRRRTVAFKRAFHALFDRQSSTSAEIEFGGAFPLSEIVKLTHKNAEHADATLLRLIGHANRSRYEEVGNGLLTDAEFALLEYIDAEHERLSRSLA